MDHFFQYLKSDQKKGLEKMGPNQKKGPEKMRLNSLCPIYLRGLPSGRPNTYTVHSDNEWLLLLIVLIVSLSPMKGFILQFRIISAPVLIHLIYFFSY